MVIVLRPLIWCGIIPLVLSACAARSDKNPSITILDFRAQNVERLHDGVIALVGDDSAGLAAREYIRAFGEDLASRLPAQSAMPAPVAKEPDIPSGAEWNLRESYERMWGINQEYRSINSMPPDPRLLELKRYLDGRKTEAIGDLRRRNDAFTGRGGRAEAKMGIAAAYVATSCANEPGDVETITRLVEPLLNELTKH